MNPNLNADTSDPRRALGKRAARLLRRGEARKAALLLREAVGHTPDGPIFVRLAHVLLQQDKLDEALWALKQALYCFRHEHQRGRARTVARLILRLDPGDASAQRVEARGSARERKVEARGSAREHQEAA